MVMVYCLEDQVTSLLARTLSFHCSFGVGPEASLAVGPAGMP